MQTQKKEKNPQKRRTQKRKPQKKKVKKRRNLLILKSRTPRDIGRVSELIAESLPQGKEKGLGRGTQNPLYEPTINQELVTLHSIPRGNMQNCNNERAFQLLEPLKIAIQGSSSFSFFGNTCVPYSSTKAKEFLLRNLSANKHVNPDIIVPPMQSQSNCWFNTMFTTLFISDKGRTFFHYFRELMIRGKQANGSPIPTKLADAFALLNFAVDSALTGSSYAYELNTNQIIEQIYQSIPEKYRARFPYLVGVDKASNPIRYYGSILQYLDERSLQILFLSDMKSGSDWRTRVTRDMTTQPHIPHVIIFEIFDDESKTMQKPTHFTVENADYELDSCVVRDTSKQHFCATLLCEGKQMAYDGMSFHRLVPMTWKPMINTGDSWTFEGSPLTWRYTEGYQLLLYYRIK